MPNYEYYSPSLLRKSWVIYQAKTGGKQTTM